MILGNGSVADQDCDAPSAPPDCEEISGIWNWVDPGAFAIYGSAAFFGGISRLHLTVPVILMEISGQTRYAISPVEVTTFGNNAVCC